MSAEISGQLMCLGVGQDVRPHVRTNISSGDNRIGEIYNRQVIKWELGRLALAARAFASAGESIRRLLM